MFFYKVEGHTPKLSSFGQGKTIRPKKSLTSFLHAALQLCNKGCECEVENLKNAVVQVILRTRLFSFNNMYIIYSNI